MRLPTPLLLLLILAVILGGCLPGHVVYASGPYQGRVIDAETKQPLAGAAVVAVWYQESSIFGGTAPALDYHDALEVVTDAEGQFTLPARTHFTLIGKIREPRLVVYSSGYISGGTHPLDERHRREYERKEFAIELLRAKTREERIRHADRPDVLDGRVPDSKIPTMLQLINREAEDLGLRPIGGRRER